MTWWHEMSQFHFCFLQDFSLIVPSIYFKLRGEREKQGLFCIRWVLFACLWQKLPFFLSLALSSPDYKKKTDQSILISKNQVFIRFLAGNSPLPNISNPFSHLGLPSRPLPWIIYIGGFLFWVDFKGGFWSVSLSFSNSISGFSSRLRNFAIGCWRNDGFFYHSIKGRVLRR